MYTLSLDEFKFPAFERHDDEEKGRTYSSEQCYQVPSVTTILKHTLPREKQESLDKWKHNYDSEHGSGSADAFTQESADNGTKMHNLLEEWILKKEKVIPDTEKESSHYKQASLIYDYLCSTDYEVLGSEAFLHNSPPLQYAGSCDLIVRDPKTQEIIIIDFKQSNKPKKDGWITDYKLQCTFYGNSFHDMFKIPINQAIILIANRGTFELQIFKADTRVYRGQCLDRLSEYYRKKNF